MNAKTPVAIVGSGNIGTDLLVKLMRSPVLELCAMVGVDPRSRGLALARELGVPSSADGIEWLLERGDLPAIVFEATSASVHEANAPRYADAGIRVVDLTPAALGPFVVPSVNLADHLDAPNINMVTCGGQATVPIVHAVSRVVDVDYAEIVATIASASAGPGTRANIDEFTRTTSRALSEVGGARRGKSIIILNPAVPPLLMRDTVFCQIPGEADHDELTASIVAAVEEVARFVPGYRLTVPPQFDTTDDGVPRVAVFLEVEGAGDFLPPYAGNLDIMTAAAARVGEMLASEGMRNGLR